MGRSRELAELATAYDGGSLGFRNRIINGDMRIDQRNNGASLSPAPVASTFVTDRWAVGNSTTTVTMQRSTTAPAGFTNSLQLTNGTGASPASGVANFIIQQIEGFNVADLAFGTASAATVTLSFWVRSSVTGTYSIRLVNGATTRSYVATYTINAANAFEYKTITIPGDTSGTWLVDNGIGLQVLFDMGSGSNFNTTVGSWQTGNFTRTSGSVTWCATTGATFFLTGVQLEAGSVATPFERRDYGRELVMCQRYFYREANGLYRNFGVVASGGYASVEVSLPVTMRATPTMSVFGYVSGTAGRVSYFSGVWTDTTAVSPAAFSPNIVYAQYNNVTVAADMGFRFTASAEL